MLEKRQIFVLFRDDGNPYWFNRMNVNNRPVGESPGDAASSESSSSGVSRGGRAPLVDVVPTPISLPVSANVSAPARYKFALKFNHLI